MTKLQPWRERNRDTTSMVFQPPISQFSNQKKGTPLHAKKCKRVTSSGHTALPVISPYTEKINMISYVESGHTAPNANAATKQKNTTSILSIEMWIIIYLQHILTFNQVSPETNS